jgi:large subunit ribosomal protein L29
MKTQEFRAMNNADLAHKLDESYQELFNLRFQRATGKLTNTARMNIVRKEIARMKTILRERELAGAA